MDFKQAVEVVNSLKDRDDITVTNDDLSKLYGLYKQATVGDVNTERPGGFLDVKGKAKWDAWKACEGVQDAEAQYVQYVIMLENRRQ